jgi:hypothetical protein
MACAQMVRNDQLAAGNGPRPITDVLLRRRITTSRTSTLDPVLTIKVLPEVRLAYSYTESLLLTYDCSVGIFGMYKEPADPVGPAHKYGSSTGLAPLPRDPWGYQHQGYGETRYPYSPSFKTVAESSPPGLWPGQYTPALRSPVQGTPPKYPAPSRSSTGGKQQYVPPHKEIQRHNDQRLRQQEMEEMAIGADNEQRDVAIRDPRIFNPFRYLSTQRKQDLSLISHEAQDGTAVCAFGSILLSFSLKSLRLSGKHSCWLTNGIYPQHPSFPHSR